MLRKRLIQIYGGMVQWEVHNNPINMRVVMLNSSCKKVSVAEWNVEVSRRRKKDVRNLLNDLFVSTHIEYYHKPVTSLSDSCKETNIRKSVTTCFWTGKTFWDSFSFVFCFLHKNLFLHSAKQMSIWSNEW